MATNNSALVWAAVGIFSLPTALVPVGLTLFSLARPTAADSAVMALTLLWVMVFFALSLARTKKLLGTDYRWEVNYSFVWPAYRDLMTLLLICVLVYIGSSLVLEYLSFSECVHADYEDGSYTTYGNCDEISPTAGGFWGWLSVIGSLENYVRWSSLLIFITLSFPILDRYFLFVECWISALHSLLETKVAISAEGSIADDRTESGEMHSIDELRARYLSNIDSCNTRIYLSIISMLLLLLIGIYSFVVVFQGSPTSKALSIVSRIEGSPALFVADFQDKVREAERALEEIGRSLWEVGPNSYANLADYSK
jgi:hypothetical protein